MIVGRTALAGALVLFLVASTAPDAMAGKIFNGGDDAPLCALGASCRTPAANQPYKPTNLHLATPFNNKVVGPANSPYCGNALLQQQCGGYHYRIVKGKDFQ